MRSDRGSFIKGFAYNGVYSMMEVELWGISNGLKIAWHADKRNLIMEVDYLHALELVKNGVNHIHLLYSMVS